MDIKKIKSGLFFVLLVFIVFGGLYVILNDKELIGDEYRTYECDYKSTSLTQTKIETTVGGEPVVIKGGAIAKLWITDPLVMSDGEGNVIATYKSMLGMNDYTVKICDNDICSDEALLLVFASYVSDAKYDR